MSASCLVRPSCIAARLRTSSGHSTYSARQTSANLPRELIDPLTVGAVRALVRAGRFGEIESYVARPEVADSPVMVATIRAYASLRQGQQTQTAQFLDEAVAARRATDTRSLTNFLGRLLLEAGRPSDALPLLQELFDAQTPNFDVGLLLRCAGLLEREQVILDTCQALYERGSRDWELLEFESQYLEDRDHQKAIARLQEFIAANPDHRVARLRLATIAMRYGLNDIAPLTNDTLPSPDELPMRYAVAAVRVLQWQNQSTLAVDYCLPRAARPHVGDRGPQSLPRKPDAVALDPTSRRRWKRSRSGSAVEYSENSDAAVGWFVIEDTDKPNNEFEETPASDDLANELLGKRVGDTFVRVKQPREEPRRQDHADSQQVHAALPGHGRTDGVEVPWSDHHLDAPRSTAREAHRRRHPADARHDQGALGSRSQTP